MNISSNNYLIIDNILKELDRLTPRGSGKDLISIAKKSLLAIKKRKLLSVKEPLRNSVTERSGVTELPIVADNGIDSSREVIAYCDGGTSSNVPPFGDAYGSFKIIQNGVIIIFSRRDEFGQGSNNFAEARAVLCTLLFALKNKLTITELYCDSQNMVMRVNDYLNGKDKKLSNKSSLPFVEECIKIRNLIFANRGYKNQLLKKAVWVPRNKIVAVLGH